MAMGTSLNKELISVNFNQRYFERTMGVRYSSDTCSKPNTFLSMEITLLGFVFLNFPPCLFQVILAGTLTGVQGDIRRKVLAALSTVK